MTLTIARTTWLDDLYGTPTRTVKGSGIRMGDFLIAEEGVVTSVGEPYLGGVYLGIRREDGADKVEVRINTKYAIIRK